MGAGLIPVDRLHHVNVVVKDLEATARNYALLLGVDRWEVARLGAERLRDTSAFGFDAPYTYMTATGSNAQGVTFRLVQPTGGLSTYAEFLITRGEGIHSLCLAVMGEREFERLGVGLRDCGVAIGQAATVDGGARHYHLDTRTSLGGFFVEVVVTGDGGERTPRADESWDFHDEGRPPGEAGDLWAMPRIWHFGVAVNSVMSKLPAYASLFGLNDWTFVHFRPEPGSLDHSMLNGSEVEYSSLLAKADLDDFGFEVLQSMAGPTHYKEEFIDRVGEGIHHVLALPAQEEPASLRLRRWMASLDVPVAMSGRVRHGAAEFFYLDTRRRLGGFLIETICRYRRADARPVRPSRPDYTFDFSKEASW